MKILAFGEVLWDFIDGEKYFGGAPLNFAAHVVKCGEESGIVTALGTDKLGDDALQALQNLGVRDEFVQRNAAKITGRVMVFLHNGQPTYRITKDVAYDYIESRLIDLRKAAGYDAFYFGTLAQRSPESRNALYHILDNVSFRTIFYDVNLRRESYTVEVISKSLEYATIVKMNHEEVVTISQLLYGQPMEEAAFASRLRQEYHQIDMVLVTGGAKGCTIYTQTATHQVPAQPVEVQDTVGAGDAFCAAFITTLLRGNEVKKAARMGNMVGGFVATQSGAVPEYPDRFRKRVELLSE